MNLFKYARPFVIVYGGLLALSFLFRADSRILTGVFDDALMFVRYADNMIAGNGISWNPHGGPVYGTTSLGYLFTVAGIRMIFSSVASIVIIHKISVFITILFFVIFAIYLNYRSIRQELKELKWIFLLLSFSSSLVWENAENGMETFSGVMVLFLFLVLIYEINNQTFGAIFLTGLTGLLLYFTRPDLFIYPAVILSGMFVLDSKSRKTWFIKGSVLLVLLALSFGLIFQYFGHYFPLPFYVKGQMLKIEYGVNNDNFIEFISHPVTILMLFIVIFQIRFHLRNRLSALIALSLVLHAVYLLYFTNQQMGMHARFYFPDYSALLFLAAIGFDSIELPSKYKYFQWIVIVLVLYAVSLSFVNIRKSSFKRAIKTEDDYFNIIGNSLNLQGDQDKKGVIFLEKIRKLPADCSAAGTEMGIQGLIFKNNPVYDMVGLNYPEYVFSGKNIVSLVMEQKPDVIIMPHPDQVYKPIYEGLVKNRIFLEEYYGIYPLEVKMPMGVAFYAGSKCWPLFDEILQELKIPRGLVKERFTGENYKKLFNIFL